MSLFAKVRTQPPKRGPVVSITREPVIYADRDGNIIGEYHEWEAHVLARPPLFTVACKYPCCRRTAWLDVHDLPTETYVKTCRRCKIEWHVVRRLASMEGTEREDKFDWHDAK